jgi:hypothetical protein
VLIDRLTYYLNLMTLVLQLYGCTKRHIGGLSTGFRAILPEGAVDQFTSLCLHPPSAVIFWVVDTFFAFLIDRLLSRHATLLVTL